MPAGTEVGAIYYDLDLNTAMFDANMLQAKAKAGLFSNELTDIGGKVSKLGSAFMPFSIAAGAALGLSVKAALDFNQTMELLHTSAGASTKQVQEMTPKVEALASQVGFSPTSLANALYHVTSAGEGIFSTSQQLDILKLAAEGAQVGQADLNDTTYALTSTMATQVKGAQSATEAMGLLNAIVGAGDMHMQDLNGAISTGFLSTAKVFGVSLRSIGTALATLTDNGEPATEAATRLRMTMSLMGAPTQQAMKALEAVGLKSTAAMSSIKGMDAVLEKAGVSQATLAGDMRKPNGITVAMEDLKKHLEAAGLSSSAAAATMARAFGGGRSDAAMLTLLTNIDRMNTKFGIIGENAGKFQSDWASQQQQAKQKMEDFKASIQTLQVQLGNAFLPTLENLVKDLGKVASWFGHLSDGNKKLIADFLLFVAALGPVLKVVGDLIKLGGYLKSIIDVLYTAFLRLAVEVGVELGLSMGAAIIATAGIIAAVALLAVGVYELVKHWSTVSKFFDRMWQDVEGFFRRHLKVIEDILLLGLLGPLGLIVANWKAFSGWIKGIVGDVVQIFRNLFDFFTGGDITLTADHLSKPFIIWVQTLLRVRQDVLNWIHDIVSWFAQTPHHILQVLDAIAFMIGYELRLWKDLFMHWIPDIVRAIVNEMKKLPGQIASIMSSVWDATTSWLSRMWHDAVNIVSAMYRGIINWFVQLPGRATKVGHDTWSAFTSWISRMWHDTTSFISQMISTIVRIITGLPGDISRIGSSMARAARSAASGIWHGFMDTLNQLPKLISGIWDKVYDGIKGAAGKLADGAKHVASSMWSSFKSGLGIHSPSYIEQAFSNIADEGDKTVSKLTNSVSKLTSLSQKATTAVSGSKTTGLGGVNNTMAFANLTINGDLNFQNQSDINYFFQKLGRNVELTQQGLTPIG
jgi:TP901 family phage tail tape measure protein